MQAGFDQSMLTPELKHFGWWSLVSGKAGNAMLDLTACFVDLSPADPGELAFQAIHLSNGGPVDVIIEHGAGLNSAFFEPSVPEIDLANGQEVSRNLAKTGFGLVRGEQTLNIFVEPRLVFLDDCLTPV